MHLKRVITALIFIPLAYIYVMYLPVRYFLFPLIIFSTVALAEFYVICGVEGLQRYTGLTLGAILLAVLSMKGRYFWPDAAIATFMVIAGVRLISRRGTAGSIMDVAYTFIGLMYIPGLLSFQLDLVRQGPRLIIMLYASVWAADSAAYYVGKGIGRMKLYPSVSPNKTVEGALASVVGGCLGALLIWVLMMKHMAAWKFVLIGSCIGAVTIVGDLVESMFKRDAGVKDSGETIPGHGGVLDKLDGVLFAGPAFYWLLRALKVI